jgi:hypothetical protein
MDFEINEFDVQSAWAVLQYLIGTWSYMHDAIYDTSDYTLMNAAELSKFRKTLILKLAEKEANLVVKDATAAVNLVTPSAAKLSYTTAASWLRENKNPKK